MGNQQWNNRKKIFDKDKLDFDLGYVLGVYIGDGWVEETDNYHLLGLYTIDRDFVEYFRNTLCRIFNDIKLPQIHSRTRTTHISGKTYEREYQELRVGCKTLCLWLKSETKDKLDFPVWIDTSPLEFKRGLIHGLMDSEGWFAQTQRNKLNRMLYRLGFACCNKQITAGLKKLFMDFGIKSGNLVETTCKSGKTLYTLWIDKYAFSKQSFYFSIKRKQSRLENFIKEYKLLIGPSETAHQDPEMDMIQSDL